MLQNSIIKHYLKITRIMIHPIYTRIHTKIAVCSHYATLEQ